MADNNRYYIVSATALSEWGHSQGLTKAEVNANLSSMDYADVGQYDLIVIKGEEVEVAHTLRLVE